MKPQHGKRRLRMLSSASAISRVISDVDVDRLDIGELCRLIIVRLKSIERSPSYPAVRSDYTKKIDRPRCGAKTRAGGTCKAPAVYDHVNNRIRNERCRMHGGLSTGPRKRKSLPTE